MIINRENLQAMFRAYSTAFQQGITRTPLIPIDFMYRDFPSTTKANFYAWMDFIEGFREWVGDRVFNNITAQMFEVLNRDFECSHSIGRNDILDDTYGIHTPLLQMKAEAWPLKLQDLVIGVMTENPVCFTGRNLIAANHALGGQTLNNRTTSALTVATFETAFEESAEWKFANKELIKPTWTHLVVGEALRSTAWKIVEAREKLVTITNQAGTENVGGAMEPNPQAGRCKLVVLPEFAGDYANHWRLLDCSKPVKPVARQIRETPVPKMDEDPDLVEKSGKADFFATGRAAAAPTFPWLVYGGIVAA